MIYSVPPPFPGEGSPPGSGPQPSEMRHDRGGDNGESWLSSRRRGRVSTRLSLRLVDAFLVSDDAEGPAAGLVRFSAPDTGNAVRARRSWRRRAPLERQLAQSGGELRLLRDRLADETGAGSSPLVVLTLNGVTDIATLERLNVGDPSPLIPGKKSGHVAAVGVDVRFLASLWGLAVPKHTRCRLHLEGLVRLRPDWPVPR